MKSIQRVIKYVAIAFAIFLTVNIIFGIVMAFTSILGITSIVSSKNTETNTNLPSYGKTFTNNINALDIDVGISKLYITKGDSFSVEAKNSKTKFDIKEENGVLKIKEDTKELFNVISEDSTIYVYIPENTKLDYIKISTGISKSEISSITTNKFDLNVGVGDIKISNVKSINVTKIEGGAGKTEIIDCYFNNLDLDCGVGDVNITAEILGNSKVECGLGNLDFTLIGDKEDYTISTEIGIGTIKVNNEKVDSDTTIGNGINLIKFECGIGNTNINFVKKGTDF